MTKELRDSPGFKERRQVYQTDMGWCFAFSSADIISQKIGRAISPIDIAIRYYKYFGVTDFDLKMQSLYGAHLDKVSNMVKAQTYYCAEQNYAVNDLRFLSYPITDVHKNFKLLSEGCVPEITMGADVFFKNLSDIKSVMIAIKKESENKMDFLAKLNRENCKEKIDVKIEMVVKDHVSSWSNEKAHDETKDYLMDLLRKNKMISAGIDASLLMNFKEPFFDRLKSHFLGDHAVTITGMVESNGQCFFQIRDSNIPSEAYCNKAKADPRISCTGGQGYNVPDDVFLKSIKQSVFVR